MSSMKLLAQKMAAIRRENERMAKALKEAQEAQQEHAEVLEVAEWHRRETAHTIRVLQERLEDAEDALLRKQEGDGQVVGEGIGEDTETQSSVPPSVIDAATSREQSGGEQVDRIVNPIETSQVGDDTESATDAASELSLSTAVSELSLSGTDDVQNSKYRSPRSSIATSVPFGSVGSNCPPKMTRVSPGRKSSIPLPISPNSSADTPNKALKPPKTPISRGSSPVERRTTPVDRRTPTRMSFSGRKTPVQRAERRLSNARSPSFSL